MALQPEKTAVIYLGADEFLKSPGFEASEAFTHAQKRIASYFNEKIGLPEKNVLNLFNASMGADQQDESIANFIKERVQAGILDLFIYYVGHGSFTPTDQTFYLALKGTRTDNPGLSSLTTTSLATSINSWANSIRSYIILDCCFSAAAGTAFMGGNDVAAVQLKETFNSKGVALFCATSKDLPALIVKDRKITMFTEGLDHALKNGDKGINKKHLTLRQIYQITNEFIKHQNAADAVQPYLYALKQPEGDIAELPKFENFSYKEARFDIFSKKREIEEEIIQSNFRNLGNAFIDFVREFDETTSYRMESLLICAECIDLIEQKTLLLRTEFIAARADVFTKIINVVDQIINRNSELNSKDNAEG